MGLGLEKFAKKDNDPSWWGKQKGIVRASTDGGEEGKGSSYAGIANSDLIGERVKGSLKGLAAGAGGGALAGLIASAISKGKFKPGLSSATGAALGGLVGEGVGSYKADKKYLKNKGIDLKWGGLTSEFSPEAREKYIDAYEKKAGVNIIGLEKFAKKDDQDFDSNSAAMEQSVGKLGLAKSRMKGDKDSQSGPEDTHLAEQTRQSGEEDMDKKASEALDQSLGILKTKKKSEKKKEDMDKEAMGLARAAAKAIKGPAKVNEVMKAVPKSKRDDVLKQLRKSKK